MILCAMRLNKILLRTILCYTIIYYKQFLNVEKNIVLNLKK